MKLNINGQVREIQAEPDTPLLWVVREELGLTGTRFGCGMGLCGACTMHLDGMAVRTCILPVAAVGEQAVTTIEGLGGRHPVQQAWLEEQVPQCGYCQPGQMMAACAFLEKNRAPTDEEIAVGITNLCRCGTYDRIRAGIKRAAKAMGPLPVAEVAPAELPVPDAPPAGGVVPVALPAEGGAHE